MRANVICLSFLVFTRRLSRKLGRPCQSALVTAAIGFGCLQTVTASAETLLPGTRIEARLLSTTGSGVSRAGDVITATVIAPVTTTIEGETQIVIPPGSTLLGTIGQVNRLGLGLRHKSASITYDLNRLILPGRQAVSISARVTEVETAKEDVDVKGTVYGTHPTANVSSTVSFYTLPLIYTIPVLRIPVWTAKFIIARSPDPEIHFPAGTEVFLRLTAPVEIPVTAMNLSFSRLLEPAEVRQVEQTLSNGALTRAEYDKRPSDLVNIVLLGTHESVQRAFAAAGWSGSDRTSAMSLYRMYHCVLSRKGYTTAPMDRLTLNGKAADASYQKSLDTFAKRHHVRFWRQPVHGGSDSAEMWLGSATEDIAFRVRHMHMAHAIDPHIDNERAKIANDLLFTGCVDSVSVAKAARGTISNRKPMVDPITDGNVAVLQLNACDHPQLFPKDPVASGRGKRNGFVKTLIAIRDDIPRSNVLFIAFDTIRLLATHSSPTFARQALAEKDRRSLEWITAAPAPRIVSVSQNICSSAGQCLTATP